MNILWGMVRELHAESWRCTLRFLESLVCKIRNYRNDSRHQGPTLWNCEQQLRKKLRQHTRKQWKLKGKFILPKVCRTEILVWVALLSGGMEAIKAPLSINFPREWKHVRCDASTKMGCGFAELANNGICASQFHKQPSLQLLKQMTTNGKCNIWNAAHRHLTHDAVTMADGSTLIWSSLNSYWSLFHQLRIATEIELICIAATADTFGRTYGCGLHLCIRYDCTGAVGAANKLRSPRMVMNALALSLREILRRWDMTISVCYITGKDMTKLSAISKYRDTIYVADALSRGAIEEVRGVMRQLKCKLHSYRKWRRYLCPKV